LQCSTPLRLWVVRNFDANWQLRWLILMKPDFQKVLVTGGAGFIGSHLVDALLSAGCEVRVLDNLSTGKLSNLCKVHSHINFLHGDIRDSEMVLRAVDKCEVIFHQAAVVSVPQTVEQPVGSAMVNELGTLNILEAARNAGVKRVIIASSCAVYGDSPELPKHESMIPNPLSPYAVQKLTGEYYARLYHQLYGLETVCLRYFNVYGPRQDPTSPYSGVISIFLNKAVLNQGPVIYGDGNQSRDFVFVGDVVHANILAASCTGIIAQPFNVGTGKNVRINRLWEMIARLSHVNISADYRSWRSGDINESVADISRSKNILKFVPAYSFEDGLRLTWQWYNSAQRKI